MHLSIYICMHSCETLVSLFTYLNHLHVYAFLCIFVHLSEPFVSLCANLNYLYLWISVNLCIFFHSSEPSVSLCIWVDHFSLSPVSTSTCAVPFWMVSICSYNPVFWFSAAFLYSFISVHPSCPAVCMRCEADIFIPYTLVYSVYYRGDCFWPWFCKIIYQ